MSLSYLSQRKIQASWEDLCISMLILKCVSLIPVVFLMILFVCFIVTGSGWGFRMGDKPIWEQIGSSFVQHYYQLFDADRTQLGAIYVSIHRKGVGLLSHYGSGIPCFDVWEYTGWDNGLYPNSRMPVSAITLTFIYCISFLFHFCFELCLPYRQSDSQKPCLAVGSDFFLEEFDDNPVMKCSVKTNIQVLVCHQFTGMDLLESLLKWDVI